MRNDRDKANLVVDDDGVEREVNQTLYGWGAGAEFRFRQNFVEQE